MNLRHPFFFAAISPLFCALLLLNPQGKVGPAEGCSGIGQYVCTRAGWTDASLPRAGLDVPTDGQIHVNLSASGGCTEETSGASGAGAGGAGALGVSLLDAQGQMVATHLAADLPGLSQQLSTPTPSEYSASVVLIPDAPLAPGGGYNVRVEGLLGGPKELPFQTAGGPTTPPVSTVQATLDGKDTRQSGQVCCTRRNNSASSCGPYAITTCEGLFEETASKIKIQAGLTGPGYSEGDIELSIEHTDPGGATQTLTPITGQAAIVQVSGLEVGAGQHCFVAVAKNTVTGQEGRSDKACVDLPKDTSKVTRCDEARGVIASCGAAGASGQAGPDNSDQLSFDGTSQAELDATCAAPASAASTPAPSSGCRMGAPGAPTPAPVALGLLLVGALASRRKR